jgi:hypothetical protein
MRPSRVQPMRMRWMVAGRWVVLLNIRARCSVTLTGRLGLPRAQRRQQRFRAQEQLAAEAAADVGRHQVHVLLGMPRVLAMSFMPQLTIWLAVKMVSLSPSHFAIEACGSIIACDWSGVV